MGADGTAGGGFSGIGMVFEKPRDDQVALPSGDYCLLVVFRRRLNYRANRCFPYRKGLGKQNRNGEAGRRSALHNYGAGEILGTLVPKATCGT